jgi:hypothetical protein
MPENPRESKTPSACAFGADGGPGIGTPLRIEVYVARIAGSGLAASIAATKPQLDGEGRSTTLPVRDEAME